VKERKRERDGKRENHKKKFERDRERVRERDGKRENHKKKLERDRESE
jgi:hypothetical protein